MFLQFITKLKAISHSHLYWLFLIVSGCLLLSTALYYQHSLNELPCVVCIQIRLLISLLILISIIAMFVRHNTLFNSLTHLFVVLIAVSFVERCYLLLGTEKGFVFADCGFSLGLPDWFAIEQWLPWLYRIETSCGYTPEILLGITMAEALMVLSVSLLIFSSCLFGSIFIKVR